MTQGMTQMMNGGMWAWMLLWALVGVAILTVAVVVTVRLVRGGHATGPGHPTRSAQTESADEVLRRRYANGEIDEDEYLKRRSGLDM